MTPDHAVPDGLRTPVASAYDNKEFPWLVPARLVNR
jgi:hypothetical protein